jgi:hypothetical protein
MILDAIWVQLPWHGCCYPTADAPFSLPPKLLLLPIMNHATMLLLPLLSIARVVITCC